MAPRPLHAALILLALLAATQPALFYASIAQAEMPKSSMVYYTAESVHAEGGDVPRVYFVLPGRGAALFLAPPAGPMLSGVEAYFNVLRSNIAVYNYTVGSWSVVVVEYNASLGVVKQWSPPRVRVLRPDLVLEKRIMVARSGDQALVVLEYTNHAGQAVRLEQYPTHIHRGVDGVTVALVPEGFRPGMEGEQWVGDALKLLRETSLYIGGKSYGSLASLGLWESLPPGTIAFQGDSVGICVRSLDELSSSRLIQVMTAEQYAPAKRPIANSRLELQHETITLEPGEKARYIYLIGLSKRGCEEIKAISASKAQQLLESLEAIGTGKLIGVEKPRAEIPVTDGLVAYYSFDGCSLEDFSGNGHDLRVLHGSFACIEGPWGGAAYFDGHTALASEPFPWPSNSFTIAYMIRVDKPYENVNGGLWVIAVTRGADSSDFTDPMTSSFALQFHVRRYNSSFVLAVPHLRLTSSGGYFVKDLDNAGVVVFRRGSWMFIAASYDAGSGVFRLYVDGVKVYEGRVGRYPVSRHPMPLLLGYDPHGYIEYHIGGLDEVLVYSRALGDEEVEALYEWLSGRVAGAAACKPVTRTVTETVTETKTVTVPVPGAAATTTVTATAYTTLTRTVERKVTVTETVTAPGATATKTLEKTVTVTTAAPGGALGRTDLYATAAILAAAVLAAGLLAGRKR